MIVHCDLPIRQLKRHSVTRCKVPKRFVYSQDLDLTQCPPALLAAELSLQQQHRRTSQPLPAHFCSQFISKESLSRDEDLIDLSNPIPRNFTERFLDRVTGQKRTQEHRGTQNRSCPNAEIRQLEVPDPPTDEGQSIHRFSSLPPRSS